MLKTNLATSCAVAFSLACATGSHAQATATRAPNVAASAAAKSGEDTLTSKFEVSGIPVILRQVTANNVVAANLYLLGGVRQLTPQTQGIETLLLESSEYGTRKYPKNVLRQKMARLGSADWCQPGHRLDERGAACHDYRI